MIDSLNAEVALGTIANVPEAIQWLGYTYLFGQLLALGRGAELTSSSNAKGAVHLRHAA
jgi:hypothetical protein